MPRIEIEVIHPEVPAQPAVTKQVMVLTVDQEIKDIFDGDHVVSLWNRWLYPILLVFLWAVFYTHDFFGEYAVECQEYHHGDCVDGRGIGMFFVPIFITILVMLPALLAAVYRKRMREHILTSFGWDGKSTWRLEVAKSTED